MKTVIDSRGRSAAAAIALVAAVALVLCGCVPTPRATPSGSPASTGSTPATGTPSELPTGSPTPTSTTPTSTPAPGSTTGTATRIPCGTLISAKAIYDFNANFGLDSGFSPKSGSVAAAIVADQGTACNWLNQTSGDTVTFAVARPAPEKLASLKAQAATGTPAAGLGDAAYFSTSGGVGRVDAFRGSYWLVATSVYFGNAADASSLVGTALGALK